MNAQLLLKNLRVIDPEGPHHNQKTDILVVGGQIAQVAPQIQSDVAETWSCDGSMVSIGWCELRAQLGTPGLEDRETLNTGLSAAAKGGFTRVAVVPDTNPAIDTASGVSFLRNLQTQNPVELWVLGAITTQLKGQQLAELYDMSDAGAMGFSDHKHPIQNTNLLKLALQYAQVVEKPIFSFPFEPQLARNGVMNEGVQSTYLGLAGMPNLSEYIIVQRDIQIQHYTGGHLHFAGISTQESVEMVAAAKARGQKITADVSFYNLITTDAQLETYDSLFKLNPPLRSEKDVAALWEGLKDGTIDAISTDHDPWNIERKACEFEHAAFGMAAMENAFTALIQAMPNGFQIEKLIAALSRNPLRIFNQKPEVIDAGNPAYLTIFNLEASAQLPSKRASQATNDPFQNQNKRGGVLGIVTPKGSMRFF